MTKDQNGYQFVNDYENRIVAAFDASDAPVATFDYDAMGRRIRKTDNITPAESRTYWHNESMQ